MWKLKKNNPEHIARVKIIWNPKPDVLFYLKK